ncbi:MAG TPA: RnfABCDGE type electron transport complex subunit D [Candidatus Tetragenococcus pullicola]|nr:RnfABCDGE type electron transport complex subunit D [Candidatus Tetragenococcus pullicola]
MANDYKKPASEKIFQQAKTAHSIEANPHIRHDNTTKKIMVTVLLSLVPAVLFSGYLFGFTVYVRYLTAILTALICEYVWFKIIKRPYQLDYSVIVTAVLLTMSLPPSAPWYFPVIATSFAIIVIKEFFGGLGYNFLNPALSGRSLLVGLFYNQMFLVSWPDPPFNKIAPDVVAAATANDAISGATPLDIMRSGTSLTTAELRDSFFGVIGGRIGETSALLLILGGLFLIYKKIISPRIPLIIIGTVALFAFILGPDGLFTGSLTNVLGHVISGGLLLGAFYMATDYASTPATKMGENIFALGVGLLIVLFRFFGITNEGVSYAILIMNCLTPTIDRLLRLRVVGEPGANFTDIKINH